MSNYFDEKQKSLKSIATASGTKTGLILAVEKFGHWREFWCRNNKLSFKNSNALISVKFDSFTIVEVELTASDTLVTVLGTLFNVSEGLNFDSREKFKL